MKSLFFYAVVLLFFASCQKHDYPVNGSHLHTGRVIGSMCGNITVQLTDGSPYGQNGWSSPISSNSAKYDHVFRVGNPCNWGGGELNSIVNFRFVPASAQTCVLCMVFVPTPDTTYYIEVIH
jgi:hypothetical protein